MSILLALHQRRLCNLVHPLKLPRPSRPIQERPHIKPIVIGAVRFGMVRRCERGHFVTVGRVVVEEEFDFGGNVGDGGCGPLA